FVSIAMLTNRILLILALFISILYLLPVVKLFTFLNKRKFFILFLIAFLSRLLMLKIVVVPDVDIFFNLKYRVMEITRFQNPYRVDYQYPQNLSIIPSFYPYGPLLAPLMVPFNFFGDPRYALILSDFITALVLYKLVSPKKTIIKQLVPLIFLYAPQSLFFASVSAVDNIIVALFTLFFYWFYQKKYIFAFLAFSFIGGIKHAYALTIFFTLKNKNPKKVILPFLVFLAIMLISYGIFALWDFDGLKTNLLGTFTSLTNTWIVPASLSFQAFLVKQSIILPQINFQPSIVFGIIPFITIYLVTLLFLERSIYKLALAIAISLFAFIFFSPYALIQYYTVVSALILIALSLSLDPKNLND
ncbi:MAG: hypothetical protein NC935_05085, partial [Candidatus Omnitrophica bacterium]|nr:hypothetical protein [Candidatus Omnitrophota bacterium]